MSRLVSTTMAAAGGEHQALLPAQRLAGRRPDHTPAIGQQRTHGDLVGVRRVHHVDVLEVLGKVQVLRHAELGLDHDDIRTRGLDFLQQAGQFFDALGEAQTDVEHVRLLRHDRRGQTDNSDLRPVGQGE